MQRSRKPRVLLINPWIHDFAAYDFWAKPLGLLQLAGILRSHGVSVDYIDCLDRFHPRSRPVNPLARHGRGPYLKTPIPKPAGLEDVPRTYSRYGIRKSWFRESVLAVEKPDLVMVTSLMTYWYPGVRETIAELKTMLPDVPVVLGGVYASLCREHAERHSGADRVVAGLGEQHVLALVQAFTGFAMAPRFDPQQLASYPYPALDLQRRVTYAPLMTSRGCPFECAYCASRYLNPGRMEREPELVIREIDYWHRRYGVVDFAFYDDALLVNARNHILPVLEGVLRRRLSVRFHTPNALHVREVKQATAALMFAAGFETIRLGLETAAFARRGALDAKVTASEFERAVDVLQRAGFKRRQVGAYLLFGLPGQTIADIEASIRIVKNSGITPVIAHYTPIPHTALWPQAVAASRYDLEKDPVFSNNAIMPCSQEPFSWEIVSRLKRLAGDHS